MAHARGVTKLGDVLGHDRYKLVHNRLKLPRSKHRQAEGNLSSCKREGTVARDAQEGAEQQQSQSCPSRLDGPSIKIVAQSGERTSAMEDESIIG